MKHVLILAVLMAAGLGLSAQVAQYSKVFTDPVRNRQINTVIYHPQTDPSPGQQYPYIIFGHGWIMNHSLYQGLTNALVPLGYIMAYPRTEEGLFPNHLEFAKDLAFLKSALPAENLDPSSPLCLRMLDLPIVMGHSMGGGAAVLAASMEPGFASLVTFAAAETNVSAIQAAASVQMPSITFSGSNDLVAPPASHQLPIYQNLGSIYKGYVEFQGAGHLNVYENALVPALLQPWTAYLISGQVNWLDAFETLLLNNDEVLNYDIVSNLAVNLDDPQTPALASVSSYPNPFRDSTSLRVSIPKSSQARLSIYNLKGQRLADPFSGFLSRGEHTFRWNAQDPDGRQLPAGVYLYRFKTAGNEQVGKLTIRGR